MTQPYHRILGDIEILRPGATYEGPKGQPIKTVVVRVKDGPEHEVLREMIFERTTEKKGDIIHAKTT